MENKITPPQSIRAYAIGQKHNQQPTETLKRRPRYWQMLNSTKHINYNKNSTVPLCLPGSEVRWPPDLSTTCMDRPWIQLYIRCTLLLFQRMTFVCISVLPGRIKANPRAEHISESYDSVQCVRWPRIGALWLTQPIQVWWKELRSAYWLWIYTWLCGAWTVSR